METFEPNDQCAYTSYKFVEDQQGMKCLNCYRVMTLIAWEEKRKCFCGSTNVVQAIAACRSVVHRRLVSNGKPIETPKPIKTPNLQKWQILVMLAISGFLAFVAIALLSQ